MKCETKECEAEAVWRVWWPGQTRCLCNRCTEWATVIAEAVGFELGYVPVEEEEVSDASV
jgi:hypothetical protein